ncbi:MAG: helical backbone metal receptor [Gemmatimonadota bacterium]
MSVEVRDAEGRTVVLDGRPDRVLSLVPSATATLVALGARDRLVGRTDFDTASVLAGLPSVGGGLRPSLEAVVSRRPDLVIRFAGESDRTTPARLDEAGIPHLAVRPESLHDVRVMIVTLGRLVGKEAAADSILAVHRRTLDSIRARTAGLPPVRAAFALGGTPPYVAGATTFVGELIEAAGGTNVFADLDRPWAGVSPEVLVDRAPRVLLVLEGADLDPRIVRGSDVREVPAFVQLPGPHLDRAALAIARALRPDRFPAR